LAAHFRRHENSNPHVGQIFVGRSAFFFIFGIRSPTVKAVVSSASRVSQPGD
jgi:hypothetical protein